MPEISIKNKTNPPVQLGKAELDLFRGKIRSRLEALAPLGGAKRGQTFANFDFKDKNKKTIVTNWTIESISDNGDFVIQITKWS